MTIAFTPRSIVGRYEIIRKIGTGGMAEVYLAKPRNGPEDARVAIKRLLPAFADERRFQEMFVAEARLAATLHHPNIAKVFDVGIDHDIPYFSMEYVRGHDVRALLVAADAQRRPMPLAISISIMYGVTSALAYVHDPRGPHAKLNIVHRDISPSNILVSLDGAIKLVDFGIARVETGTVTRSGSGEIKGKIPYMSPEQCRARPLDGRSDLFSLGVVLYELTTNTRPFNHSSEYDILEAIVRGNFAPPSRVIPRYPIDLERIVMRLLANRPSDRYTSAGDLLVDLDPVITEHGLDLSNEALAQQVAKLFGPPEPAKPEPAPRKAAAPPKAAAPAKPPKSALPKSEPPKPATPTPALSKSEPPKPATPNAAKPKFEPPKPATPNAALPKPEPPKPELRHERLSTAPTIQLDAHHIAELCALSPQAKIPIDRIVAKCDELLERTAPGTTDARDLAAPAVAQLIGRAMRCHARGDLEPAVLALELALSAAPTTDIDELLAAHESLILAVFTAFIGDQARMPALSQHIEQLLGIAIDQRAAFLLTRIDGNISVRELLATCGLPRREACRHLCQLMLREIVVLV